MHVQAPAKINLFLEITGKRADGYHTLSTLFQTISLADRLTFSPAPRLTLTCSDPSLPTDESNLVMRAALQVQHLLKETRGARIHLRKTIPMGAGLGGGSSNAALVLLALPRLWCRRVPATALHRIARSLGADVPFFLQKGLCAATGIGDRLRVLKPLPKTWLVLVYPGFGVSTKEAYAKVKLPFTDPVSRASGDPRKNLFNRFESLVFPDHPPLPALKQQLLNLGATAALMSGSGSSVFGLVKSQAHGRQVLKHVREKYSQSWLVHTV